MSSPRPIFDAHTHVATNAADRYDLAASGRNVIFNDVDEYRSTRDSAVGRGDCASLIVPLDPEDRSFALSEAERGRIAAVKIHTRIQKVDEALWPSMLQALAQYPALPVIVDAFYYGAELRFQPSLPAVIQLAQSFPQRAVVIAHCGGYKLLEYFFHLRDLQNVWYDLSFALQYFADSSLRTDLKKLIRFTDKSRLLYGSDFPYASPSLQCAEFESLADELKLDDADRAAILAENAMRLFKVAL